MALPQVHADVIRRYMYSHSRNVQQYTLPAGCSCVYLTKCQIQHIFCEIGNRSPGWVYHRSQRTIKCHMYNIILLCCWTFTIERQSRALSHSSGSLLFFWLFQVLLFLESVHLCTRCFSAGESRWKLFFLLGSFVQPRGALSNVEDVEMLCAKLGTATAVVLYILNNSPN